MRPKHFRSVTNCLLSLFSCTFGKCPKVYPELGSEGVSQQFSRSKVALVLIVLGMSLQAPIGFPNPLEANIGSSSAGTTLGTTAPHFFKRPMLDDDRLHAISQAISTLTSFSPIYIKIEHGRPHTRHQRHTCDTLHPTPVSPTPHLPNLSPTGIYTDNFPIPPTTWNHNCMTRHVKVGTHVSRRVRHPCPMDTANM